MKPSWNALFVLCLFSLGAGRSVRGQGNAESDFKKVMGTLLSSYVDPGLNEEALYRQALAGILSGLNPRHPEWNRLYSPGEYRELNDEVSGNIIGIGVAIRFDSSGLVEILDTVTGSPAEQGGLMPQDKILEVDGNSVQGRTLAQIVASLRGDAGTTVSLSVQRSGQVFPITLTREPLPSATLESSQLANGAYRIAIHRINDSTPGLLKTALLDLTRNHATSLVLDLRGNAGGQLERVKDTASLLVPSRTTLAIRVGRDGTRQKIDTQGARQLPLIPVTVVVDGDTACGAEMLAEAMKNTVGATLVGSRTAGKWNGQAIETLPDGYAYRYTVAIFQGPRGENFDGVGLSPDVAGIPKTLGL